MYTRNHININGYTRYAASALSDTRRIVKGLVRKVTLPELIRTRHSEFTSLADEPIRRRIERPRFGAQLNFR